ncbi:hypothetical protein LX69_00145 [Breznakibacter xylanolyticus]|uniref:DUF5916 domain-containing protein n=1 Tax=Breznakibacter xylanolyticus TaxID=990 RepID=A0A2W7NLG0_9BACT|nr:DUF5916 domain-containing protein [Breznakibacter xylanolyticus]PZX20720.1 hypothetical protein LX69_00145 [Breznakibacter xylanolyticus]
MLKLCPVLVVFVGVWMIFCGFQNGKYKSVDRDKRIYVTQRIEGVPPVIDGHLLDEVWLQGDWSGDFTQQFPFEGALPSKPTDVKVLYDDKYIYVGIRAYDAKDSIDARRGRRDELFGDVVGICFDSYLDYRTGFEFDITAAGAKVDLILLNNGIDFSWNAVWDGKTALLDSMWTAEMRIPLGQLRFGNQAEQVWGLHVWRWINRLGEESQWNLIPRNNAGALYHIGELHGINQLKRGNIFEVNPYAAVISNHRKVADDNPFVRPNMMDYHLGLDGKMALSSNFTGTFTVNPDFGQVEADPAELNLTVFESYFDEKRPFFLEGRNIFDFTGFNVFYSRRVGHSPQIVPDVNNDNGEYADVPQYTTILGALKLSGKTPNGWSVGVVESLTRKEEAKVFKNGQTQTLMAEPLTNYLVARVQKDMNKGNSMVGGIISSTQRSIQVEHDLARSATTGGIDFFHHWADKNYFAKGSLIGSRVNGNAASVLALQESSSRYYQRTGAAHLEIDSALTRLSGMGSTFSIGKTARGRWRYSTGYDWRTPGLELNDLGYLTQADRITWESNLEYVVTEPHAFFRDWGAWLYEGESWTTGGEHLWSGFYGGGWMGFKNKWSVNLQLGRVLSHVDPHLLRGGPAVNVPNYWTPIVNFSTDGSKTITMNMGYNGTLSDDGVSFSHSFSPTLSFKIGQTLNLSSGIAFSKSRDQLFYVDVLDDNVSGEHYLMGQQNRQTMGVTIRASWALTPDVSLQYYGNPYVSSGTFSNYKIMTNPLSDRYDGLFDRIPSEDVAMGDDGKMHMSYRGHEFVFDLPDFEYQEFRSNFAFRWEFKPGSTFYAVWTHNRSAYHNLPNPLMSNAWSRLFDVSAHNVFMLKLSYWFPI